MSLGDLMGSRLGDGQYARLARRMPDHLWVAHGVGCRSRVERFSLILQLGGN